MPSPLLAWDNCGADRCDNTGRPLTHSLDLSEEGLAMQATRTCEVADCSRKHFGHGLCRLHYDRAKAADLLPVVERPSLTERFYEKVDVGLADECWPWTGYRSKYGYGTIWTVEAGRSEGAHRVSYRLHCGSIPPGMMVCHRCDNPPCVNPDHLFLGAQAENMADMARKGRHRKPSEPVRSGAKVTAADVRAIRSVASGGTDKGEIARRYGITRKHVNKIVGGQAWRGV